MVATSSEARKKVRLTIGKLNEIKILAIPIHIYLVMAVVVSVIAVKGDLENDMAGALVFALIMGGLFMWIGDRIPVWSKWLGGLFFCFLATSVIGTFHVVPKSVVGTLAKFNNTDGFLNLFIAVLIAGSILSFDRRVLIKAFSGFIPTVIAGTAFAFGFAVIAGLIVGRSPASTLINFALPITGGGLGQGIVPMSQMWAQNTGRDPSQWYASAFAMVNVANLIAVVIGGVLNRVGQRYPHLTGNGQLVRNQENAVSAESVSADSTVKIGTGEYAAGFGVALFLFVFSGFWALHISLINHAGWKFTISQFAYMVIFTGILNISGILPAKVRAGAKGIQRFFVRYFTPALIVLIGLGTNSHAFISAITPANVFIVLFAVIGSMVGTALMGLVFKFYPIESMLSAGLCHVAAGDVGDIMILGAAKRMDLIGISEIATRIGGAMVVVIASVVFGLWAK